MDREGNNFSDLVEEFFGVGRESCWVAEKKVVKRRYEKSTKGGDRKLYGEEILLNEN